MKRTERLGQLVQSKTLRPQSDNGPNDDDEASFVVSIPLPNVSVLGVSISRCIYFEACVSTLPSLVSRVEALDLLPSGVLVTSVYKLNHCYVRTCIGWVDASKEATAAVHIYAKFRADQSGALSRSVVVHGDLHWHVCVDDKTVLSSLELFSTLPQTICSAQDMQAVLLCVDSLENCCGNEGEKFQVLIDRKKGVFMNATGKSCVHVCTHVIVCFRYRVCCNP
jgi:hypothetical protein